MFRCHFGRVKQEGVIKPWEVKPDCLPVSTSSPAMVTVGEYILVTGGMVDSEP